MGGGGAAQSSRCPPLAHCPDTRFGKVACWPGLKLSDGGSLPTIYKSHALLNLVDAVCTVSSQLRLPGALLLRQIGVLLRRTVLCRLAVLTRTTNRANATTFRCHWLARVAAALICYPRYLDPVLANAARWKGDRHHRPSSRSPLPAGAGSIWWVLLVGSAPLCRPFCQLARELCFVRKPQNS